MIDLIELHVEHTPGMIMKLCVPMDPKVARAWENATVALEEPLTRPPRLVIRAAGDFPLRDASGSRVREVVAAVGVPYGVSAARDFRYKFEPVAVNLTNFGAESVAGAVDAAARPKALVLVWRAQEPDDGEYRNPAVRAKQLLARHPLRFIFWPFLMLLLHCADVSRAVSPNSLTLLIQVCLVLASIACISFLLAILMVMIQRKCAMCTRRWRRWWRFQALKRKLSRVSGVFGETGPCCICLAEASHSREALIVLMPCRHALHDECYRSWVLADGYPSHDLICPLCRRKADAIGKLEM